MVNQRTDTAGPAPDRPRLSALPRSFPRRTALQSACCRDSRDTAHHSYNYCPTGENLWAMNDGAKGTLRANASK